jgi:DNA topoisomerase-1
MKCKVCSRDAQQEGLCSVHFKANQNLHEKFKVWQKAKPISWSQYLVEIQKNSLTGLWAKEVAKYLIEDENKDVS